LPTRMSDEISGIQFFKVTFFSIKTDSRRAIISQFFIFAAQLPNPDGQKTCEKRRSTLRALYPAFPRKLCLPPFSHAKKQPAGSAVRTPQQQNAAGACF
ncbi:hypothetical protein, partial [Alistipes shahii]